MIHPQPTTVLLLIAAPEQRRPRPATPGPLARVLASWKAQRVDKQQRRTPAAVIEPRRRPGALRRRRDVHVVSRRRDRRGL
jgi:hypothetical protein